MTLSLAILELPARWGEVDAALSEVVSLVGESPPDLVLLPETSLTGYVSPSGDFDLRRFAEPVDGPTFLSVRRIAKSLGCAIAAPLVESHRGCFYNAHVVVSSGGDLLAHYRKIHPWFPETWATPGDLPMPVFELGGVRLGMAVCFDVHFLEAEQAEVLASIDALLFPSAWVEEDDEDSRGPVLSRLARRFDLAIANANWGPGEPSVPGQGGSRLVEPARVVRIDPSRRRLDVGLERRASRGSAQSR